MKRIFNLKYFCTQKNKLFNQIPPKINIRKPRIINYAQQQNIFIPRKTLLKKKLKKILSEGPQNIQLLCDFDYTLTKYRYGGRQSQASLGAWTNTRFIPQQLKIILTYAMILKIPTINENGIPNNKLQSQKLFRWYKFVREALIQSKLNLQMIQNIANQFSVVFRYGIQQFLEYTKIFPTFIISGGTYDFIYYWLQKLLKGQKSKIQIAANQLVYNQKKELVGFSQIIVYGRIKGFIVQSWTHKKNAIVIGDQQTDLNMSTKRERDSYISVCLLNSTIDLAQIYDNYDIIITSDPSLLGVNYLLSILNHKVDNVTRESLIGIGCGDFVKQLQSVL